MASGGDLVHLRLRVLNSLACAPAIEPDERSMTYLRPSDEADRKQGKKQRDAEERSRRGPGKRMCEHSRHRDYFVRLCALNHPVGFLSRVDGSRSRIKACGLLRASIMTQSTIHLAPILFQPRGELSLSLSPSSPIFFLVCLPLSLYLAKIVPSVRAENRRPRRQEICGFSRDRLLYTVSSAVAFFNLLPTLLYLCLPPPLLLLLVLCEPWLEKEVDFDGANSCVRVTPCCLRCRDTFSDYTLWF